MSEMWIHGAVEMTSIVISYKILPTGTEVDFKELQEQVEKALPLRAKIYANCQTEPIAFGLNALIVHIQIPEEETGILDEVERNLEKIPTVSQIQTLMVRRAR